MRGKSLPPLARPKKRKQSTYKTSESSVKAACMGWLAHHNIFVWRNNTGAIKTEGGYWLRFGLKGSADIIGMTRGGRFLAIETKSAIGELTDEQRDFRDAVMRNGGLFIISRGIDDLEKHKENILS